MSPSLFYQHSSRNSVHHLEVCVLELIISQSVLKQRFSFKNDSTLFYNNIFPLMQAAETWEGDENLGGSSVKATGGWSLRLSSAPASSLKSDPLPLKIMQFTEFFDNLFSSQNPTSCPCLCSTGSWDGLHGGLKEFCTEPVLPESRKELCLTSLNLSTDSSTASQAMNIPLVSSLQSQSTFRRLRRQGLNNNSRKQKLLLQRKKPLNSKSIKILLNIVVPLSNLGEGSFRGLWAGEDTVCVPWSAWS